MWCIPLFSGISANTVFCHQFVMAVWDGRCWEFSSSLWNKYSLLVLYEKPRSFESLNGVQALDLWDLVVCITWVCNYMLLWHSRCHPLWQLDSTQPATVLVYIYLSVCVSTERVWDKGWTDVYTHDTNYHSTTAVAAVTRLSLYYLYDISVWTYVSLY